MTDVQIVAHVLAWNMAPTGMPQDHRLYYFDRRAGWQYLTEEGRQAHQANREAVEALRAEHEQSVRAWAKQAAARVTQAVIDRG